VKPLTAPHIEIRRTDSVGVPDEDASAKPEAILPMLREILHGREQESFIMLALNNQGRVDGWREVARGMADQVQVPLREMFRTALVCDARAIIVAHNHPSGDPRPSKADILLTERMLNGAEGIGLPIVDHVIIGAGDRYYSFMRGTRGWDIYGRMAAEGAAPEVNGLRPPPDLED
jgi:DNA repair protein RadC